MRFIYLLCLLMMFTGLAPSGVAAADYGNIRFVNYSGKRYVYLKDVATYYKMQFIANGKNLTLMGKTFNMRMLCDKSYAFINDVCVHMFYPPVKKGPDALISDADFLLLIDPICRNFSIPRHPVKTVMIDPGHGGNDEGARGRLYREKDMALRLSMKLKNELEKMGYKVVMTRNNDRTLTLEQRVSACNTARADLFISIHCNKADNRSVCGVETFVFPANGTPSTYGSNNNGRAPGNQSDANNTRLGFEIHSSVLEKTDALDRGMKRARFFVIRNVYCPAVLVETGFLSNRFEERRLSEDAYQDKIVSGIADGIFKYHRAMMKIK